METSPWPRIYAPSRKYQVIMWTLAGLVVALAIGCAIGLAVEPASSRKGSDVPLWTVIAAMVLLGAFLPFSLRERFELHSDRLVHRSVVRTREFARGALGSFRFEENNGFTLLVLFDRFGKRVLREGLLFTPDEAFLGWLAALDHFDAVDLAKAQQLLVERSYSDEAPGVVERKLVRLRRVVFALNVLTAVLGALTVFWPRPFWLVIPLTALLPWPAFWLVWKFGPLVAFDGDKASRRPIVAAAIILPSSVLAIRALVDAEQLDYLPLAGPSLAVLAVLLLATWFCDRERTVPRMLLSGALLTGYAYALPTLANRHLDRAEPTTLSLTVLSKYESKGRSRERHVQVRDFRDPREEISFLVDGATYERAEPGAKLTVHVHPGAFGARWTHVLGTDH